MMSKKWFSLLVAVVALGQAGAAIGQSEYLIGNFEGGSLDGWAGASDGPAGYGGVVPPNTVPTLASLASPTVTTLGTNALRIAGGPGAANFWAISLSDATHPGLTAKVAAATAGGGGALLADVTFIASQFNIPTSNWAKWGKIAVQTTAVEWSEVQPAADPGWNAGQGNMKYTYSWPLSTINATGGPLTRIIMSIDYDRAAYAGQNAPSFFVDNIRIYPVPEPTSLTLGSVALASLGLNRRRR